MKISEGFILIGKCRMLGELMDSGLILAIASDYQKRLEALKGGNVYGALETCLNDFYNAASREWDGE